MLKMIFNDIGALLGRFAVTPAKLQAAVSAKAEHPVGSLTLPAISVRLTDLELEKRADLPPMLRNNPHVLDPTGLEFTFAAFNDAEEQVCAGKVDHIVGIQVTVHLIKTEPNHRLCGYGAASVVEISRQFGGLPIVPRSESRDGVEFWAALRKRPETAAIVGDSISWLTASQLLQRATSAAMTDKPETITVDSGLKPR